MTYLLTHIAVHESTFENTPSAAVGGCDGGGALSPSCPRCLVREASEGEGVDARDHVSR